MAAPIKFFLLVTAQALSGKLLGNKIVYHIMNGQMGEFIK